MGKISLDVHQQLTDALARNSKLEEANTLLVSAKAQLRMENEDLKAENAALKKRISELESQRGNVRFVPGIGG